MIVGAGLAGLIAAHVFPREPILEAAAEPRAMHKALLRFRSTAVGELVGIEFRPVTVRKGIWLDGAYVAPNIRVANLYARKVVGALADRSIWRLEPETRYVAPDDLYERLVDALRHRIEWNTPSAFGATATEPYISTAPMPVALKALGLWPIEEAEFRRAPITVTRYHVPGADVYQTVYHPSREHSLYRASITGSLLICEFAGEPRGNWMEDVAQSMALPGIEPLGTVAQEYGKISPINEHTRKSLIRQLTSAHNIFSLGRFATWRNILLDDVVHDASVIKRMLNASDYDRRLIAPF